MSDRVVALLRTAVPAAWGTFLLWLATVLPVSEDLMAQLGPVGTSVLAPIAVAVWYAVARKVEAHVPGWLRAILSGHPALPTGYEKPAA